MSIDVFEIDAATGEATERPFTDEEATQQKADALAQATAQNAAKKQQQARDSARAKIAEISGLTADEMAALGF